MNMLTSVLTCFCSLLSSVASCELIYLVFLPFIVASLFGVLKAFLGGARA